MDLEDAAARALSQVKALIADTAEAEARIEEERDRADETKERIESEASGLAEHARELIALAEDSRESLEREGQGTSEALGHLADRVGSVREEIRHELDGARAEVSELGQRVAAMEPRMDAVFDRLDAASLTLRTTSHEVGALMESTLAAVQELESTAARDFQRFEDVLDQRLEELRARVEEACVPTLATLAETWARSLEKVVASVAMKGALTASANLDEVAQEALQQCGASCEPLLVEVTALQVRLQVALERLGGAVEEGQRTLDAAAPHLDGYAQTGAELEAAGDALERAKTLLGRFTFVTM